MSYCYHYTYLLSVIIIYMVKEEKNYSIISNYSIIVTIITIIIVIIIIIIIIIIIKRALQNEVLIIPVYKIVFYTCGLKADVSCLGSTPTKKIALYICSVHLKEIDEKLCQLKRK